jgi:NADH:ubiquinone oxidoreductase subunit 3 (subunit A)
LSLPIGKDFKKLHFLKDSRSLLFRKKQKNFFNLKNNNKMIEYIGIFLYFIIALALASLILGLAFIFATRKADPEKISAYECGFDPFDDARSRFDIQFYLVSILFIIFDLEVTFLFPWALTLNKISYFGFWSMMVFLLILTIGFVYEWRKGALDWS